MTRWTRRIALLTGMIWALWAPAASAAPAKISWSPCYGGAFQCGTVQVPLDYDQPSGPTISIALTRLPASDPSRRIGSLFLNPGGPGGSGVDYVVGAGPFLYSDEVRAKFDLVGFDPRGVQRSTGLRCFGTQRQWGPAFVDFAFPTTAEQEQQWAAADRYLADSCRKRAGTIAAHMSTANVARDLDRLRAAVGDSRLTYAGVSYGSYLGATYANLFPNRVRALVVDGVLDPIAWSTGRGDAATTPFSTRLFSNLGAQMTLNEFFRLCDAGGPDNCALAGDAATRYAALVERLRTEPLEFTYPDGFTEIFDHTKLIGATLGALYWTGIWEDFADFLADLEAQASPAALARAYQRFRVRGVYMPKRGDAGYHNFLEPFAAVACEDSDNPTSYSAWSASAAGASGYFGPLWTWITSICAVWPYQDMDRYMGPFTAQTDSPLLIIGNYFDPATRYEGAVTLANLMPSSRLLTLDGWGHTSLFLSTCIDAAITRYLVDRTLPAVGTVCEQDIDRPFDQ
jgi:pimeloyl-ACP methyl ester carboxylesterase